MLPAKHNTFHSFIVLSYNKYLHEVWVMANNEVFAYRRRWPKCCYNENIHKKKKHTLKISTNFFKYQTQSQDKCCIFSVLGAIICNFLECKAFYLNLEIQKQRILKKLKNIFLNNFLTSSFYFMWR